MSGAPPFRLPGTHFAGAIAWLVLAGAGLVVVAPDLAAGRFLAPRVLAVTHLYTLGVITASIFATGVALFIIDFFRHAPQFDVATGADADDGDRRTRVVAA